MDISTSLFSSQHKQKKMTPENTQGQGIAPALQTEIIKLPSGATAELKTFKGRHVKEAMKYSNPDDPNVMIFAIIAMLTTIDGNKVVVEDLDDMPGADLMILMGKFGGDNFRES